MNSEKTGRGGARPGSGPKPLPPGEKREKCSPTLFPGIEDLGRAIAKEKGWPVWGQAIDQAIIDLAEKLGTPIPNHLAERIRSKK